MEFAIQDTSLKDSTATYELRPLIGGKVVSLKVKPASIDFNRGYKRALFKAEITQKRRRKMSSVEDFDIADRDSLKEFIQIASRHIIVGWENLYDADDNPVAYSPEVASDLLSQLPASEIRDLRGWVMDPDNFAATSDETTEELGNG